MQTTYSDDSYFTCQLRELQKLFKSFRRIKSKFPGVRIISVMLIIHSYKNIDTSSAKYVTGMFPLSRTLLVYTELNKFAVKYSWWLINVT